MGFSPVEYHERRLEAEDGSVLWRARAIVATCMYGQSYLWSGDAVAYHRSALETLIAEERKRFFATIERTSMPGHPTITYAALTALLGGEQRLPFFHLSEGQHVDAYVPFPCPVGIRTHLEAQHAQYCPPGGTHTIVEVTDYPPEAVWWPEGWQHG